MSSINVQGVTKSYDGQIVLADVSLTLNPGEKVGLVGANGSGKTTLFRLIMGVEPPDSGSVTTSRGLRLGFLPQAPDLPQEGSLLDAVEDALADHRGIEAELEALAEWMTAAHGTPEEAALHDKYDRLRARFDVAGGYDYTVRMKEVLGGLGFSPADYDLPVRVLSGGQKCRASLARMLLGDADFLLLDEPTNHLDIDATRWLEKYLAAHDGGAVIISHDRYLLDRVVTKIVEVEHHRVTVYPTNYTGYVDAKQIRLLNATREYDKQQVWLAHQREYIDRVRYRKDTAKQSRGRQKILGNMEARGEILDRPDAVSGPMKLRFKADRRGGDMVVRCEGACKAFGDVVLIRGLNFEMTRGERVGIIGPNGVGKTTLLRMLLRQIPADAGVVRLFENLTVGYYDQEHRDLDPNQTVIQSVRSVQPGVSESEARSFLALFLFRGDDVYKRVGDLSGGEQSRVLLARLVWRNPQVLVLDEPTNHLDIPAREALEEAMRLFEGSVLMVSHDRYFLDSVADRLLVLPERGQYEIVDGNWSTYSDLLAERETAVRAAQAQKREAEKQATARKQAATGNRRASRSKYAPQRIEDLEASIIEREGRLRELESSFADADVMKDAVKARTLHEEYNRLKIELADLNRKWEKAAEEGA